MKFKLLACSALFASMCCSAFSQTDSASKTSGYLSVGGGVSVPTASFVSATGTGFGGYATLGHTYYLQGAVIINKLHVGFAIELGSYVCGYSASKYIRNLQDTSTLTNPSYTDNGSATQYKGGYGMLGVVGELKMEKLSLLVRLMGGRFTTFFPEVIYNVTGTTKSLTAFSATYDDLSTETFSLGFEFGMNGMYHFSRHFSAFVDASFMHSGFTYGTIEKTTGFFLGNNCAISLFNITAGVSYRF